MRTLYIILGGLILWAVFAGGAKVAAGASATAQRTAFIHWKFLR
jgi:hypothetical protein